MKKNILIILLSVVSLSAFGQAGSLSQSVYRSRVNDSTTVNGSHGSGYGDFYWNNQDTNPGWRVWNGSSYDIGFSAGGNFWKNAGTTNLTGDAIIDNGAHNLLIGDLAAGPWSYWDMDGTGPVGLADTHISGIGDPLGTNHSFVQSTLGVVENGVVLQSSFTGGGLGGISVLSSAGASGVSLLANGTSSATSFVTEDGRFGVSTAGVDRLHIEANGSWEFAGTDAGLSGQVITSAGTGGPPVWGIRMLSGSATLNFDLTSVNSQDLTITVTSAADGDVVSIGVPNASATANVIYTAWVSGTNTVTVRASRIDVASGANPASGTFKAIVFK